MSFAGMRVLAFETRRATEIAELIRRQGGKAVVAPSLREAPLDSNDDAFQFADRLFAGEFEMMILLTGVGTRALNNVISEHYPPSAFPDALRKLTVVARGPKPMMALREMNVPVTVSVPEPNTWRELLKAIEGRPEKNVAVQEYGRPSPALLEGLEAQERYVTTVRVYQYALPENLEPLRAAVRELTSGAIQVSMFTTAIQVVHLAQVARQMGCEKEALEAIRRSVITSIGPTTSEVLEEYGLKPDVVPSHPKMGILIKEASEQAPDILARKG